MASPVKLTIPELVLKKAKGEKIACLTAYDWLLASLLDQTGLDLVLVGDSAAMVFDGYETTLPMTMDQMMYHTRAVSRGVRRAVVIADMPFLSFQISVEDALRNAGRFLQEGGAEGVKIEGGEPMAETIHRLVSVGIPVMGHLGLTPQSIQQFGGYRLRGKTGDESAEIKKDAKLLQEAGVFGIVLEKIPAQLAGEISRELTIPTIGIGAGPLCDGQIVVTPDMLGLYEPFKPKFVRQYASLAQTIKDAASQFVKDVKSGGFPSAEESYSV